MRAYCALLGISLFTWAGTAAAGEETWAQIADFSAGGASGATKLSASWSPVLGLFDDRVRLGLGARFNAYLVAGGAEYSGGGAKLTVSDSGQAFSLNAFAQARVLLFNGLELGANIDIIGYGFGSSAQASYELMGSSGSQPTSVSHLDLLELGSGDRGQLDSEFFIGYRFRNVGIRAGYTHFSLERTTAQPLPSGTDRFRRSFSGGFAAASLWF
jgi:hypothetical protein